MSGILTRGANETTGESTDDAGRTALDQVVRIVMDEDERGNGTLARTFLVVDVGEAVRYLRRGRGSRGETSEIADAVSELASESGRVSGSERPRESRGRGMLTRLFIVGAVVGLGYALRRRSGSVDEMVDRATDRTQRVAGTAAERTASVTGTAADRVQETGEQTADRIEEGGEQAADRIQETGEQAADRMDEAAETATEGEEEEATEAAGEGSEEAEGGETDEE